MGIELFSYLKNVLFFQEICIASYRVCENDLSRRTTDTFLSPEPTTVMIIYRQPRFTNTSYLHTVYFYCHNHVQIVDIVLSKNA